MNKLFIVHYYPIEYFPPVMNLINSLEDKLNITVSSTWKSNSLSEFKGNKVTIYRNIKEKKSNSSVKTLIKYLIFTATTLCQLIHKRPNYILYYESISAFPVYLYKRFLSPKVKLCIHYHEYMTPSEYERLGMRLSKFNHKYEISYLYRKAFWISQTNQYRKNFFLNDYPFIPQSNCHVLPNYPPQSWHVNKKTHTNNGVIKCVYVGSLSLHDTYIKEFCQWIAEQKGKVQFDIYSFNFYIDTLIAIEKLQCPYISFHKEGIKYSDIPNLFNHYDVGVLLYKAQTPNFKYNETNKFYEYLICGLDVWYPKEMILLHEMDKSVFAPQIVEMDIQNGLFPKLDFSLKTVDNSFYNRTCEKEYESFIHIIGNIDNI